MQMTPISGKRTSLFGFSVDQTRGLHVMLGVVSTIVTPADWYRRAKEALAKYDDLAIRVGRIGDQTERNNIQEWVGSPIVDGTPANKAQMVLTDIREDVELFIPANVNAYQVSSRTEKIEKLEAANRDFEGLVANGEAAHGILPIGRDAVATASVPEKPPGWLLPVLVGASAIGIAALVTYVYGGKG